MRNHSGGCTAHSGHFQKLPPRKDRFAKRIQVRFRGWMKTIIHAGSAF